MTSLPRIITVDPTWTIARIVRSAVDLTDRAVIQADVPGGTEALDEIARGGYNLLVTALHIDDNMKGFELALRVKQLSPNTAVIILGDVNDIEDLDDETRAESPFVYLRRPVNVPQFMQVLLAGIEERDIFAAYNTATNTAPRHHAEDLGPVPALDVKASHRIIDELLRDVSAMAIILSSRTGEVLLEGGAVGYLNREQLTNALLPMTKTTVAIGELIGGNTSSIQFYDGEDFDVFVLSVGFHHFISLVFDGQTGARNFGAVTRFGRRAAEDLKALLGASAYLFQQPKPVEPRKATRTMPIVKDEPLEELVYRADTWDDTPTEQPREEQRLDPIENLDLSIFDNVDKVNESQADDLFDPEALAKIASEIRSGRGPLSYDEARELGIVP